MECNLSQGGTYVFPRVLTSSIPLPPTPKVNITPFIDNLPFGKRTDSFCTADASGSTSQAASIIEALEVAVGFLRPSSTCRPGAR